MWSYRLLLSRQTLGRRNDVHIVRCASDVATQSGLVPTQEPRGQLGGYPHEYCESEKEQRKFLCWHGARSLRVPSQEPGGQLGGYPREYCESEKEQREFLCLHGAHSIRELKGRTLRRSSLVCCAPSREFFAAACSVRSVIVTAYASP